MFLYHQEEPGHPPSMHDFIFEHEINTISINEIYLMGGSRPSYVFIPSGRTRASSLHHQEEGNFFALGGGGGLYCREPWWGETIWWEGGF